MRIGFVAPRAWPAVGGAESFLHHLARALAEEHEVSVVALAAETARGDEGRLWDSLCAPKPFAPFRDGGAAVVPLPLSPGRRAALLPLGFQVVPGLRRYGYGRARVAAARWYAQVVGPVAARALGEVDVVQVWQSGFVAAAGVRAAELLGVPSVVMASLHPGSWGDDPASVSVYRRASAAAAQLEGEAEAFRQLGVPSERIRVTGACSPGVATGSGSALRARLGIDGPLVLFVGSRRPYKGADLLAAATPEIAARVPGVHVALVGPGVAPVAAHPALLDVGEVDESERAAWLDAADLLCLPSAGESFGIVVLEAWSVGTPVLTSDIPALRELVESAGGGWTAPREPAALADAIVRALVDPDELARRGERGRAAWAERYTPAAVAARFASLYEELRA